MDASFQGPLSGKVETRSCLYCRYLPRLLAGPLIGKGPGPQQMSDDEDFAQANCGWLSNLLTCLRSTPYWRLHPWLSCFSRSDLPELSRKWRESSTLSS